jgi:hypothetical protein
MWAHLLNEQFQLIACHFNRLPRGEFLYELIRTDTVNGQYVVRLLVFGTWRSVSVDDRRPFGKPHSASTQTVGDASQ